MLRIEGTDAELVEVAQRIAEKILSIAEKILSIEETWDEEDGCEHMPNDTVVCWHCREAAYRLVASSTLITIRDRA